MGKQQIYQYHNKMPHQANLHHHTMHPLGQIPPATPTTSKSPTQEMASRHTTEGLWKMNSATFLKVGLANMTNKAIINSSSIPGPTLQDQSGTIRTMMSNPSHR